MGVGCAVLTGDFIPGSVFGMILLFISLIVGLVKSESVRPVAEFLTKNMMQEWNLVKLNLLEWVLGPVVVKVFRIKHPISKGLAMGCASHGLGTARAIALMGLATSLFLPLFF